MIEERGKGMENSIYIPLQLLHSKLERWLAWSNKGLVATGNCLTTILLAV